MCRLAVKPGLGWAWLGWRAELGWAGLGSSGELGWAGLASGVGDVGSAAQKQRAFRAHTKAGGDVLDERESPMAAG
eukprot:351269-Chlamydomonas_euryale.AAC.8